MVVEALRHVVTVKKDLKLGFLDKVESLAEAAGWTSLQEKKAGTPLDPNCELEHLTCVNN